MSLSGAAQALLRAVEKATGLPGRIVVGQGALDNCCESDGWALMVTTEGLQPVDGFPAPWAGAGDTPVKCGPQIAVQFHVILARCVPLPGETGRRPFPEVEQESHLELLEVAGKAWKAVAAMSPDMMVGVASPFTVEGGCGFIDIPVFADGEEWC